MNALLVLAGIILLLFPLIYQAHFFGLSIKQCNTHDPSTNTIIRLKKVTEFAVLEVS